MRRWSRSSASSLHSSQAFSSSAVGKEIPDTLCTVSGAPGDLHTEEEFCGGHRESKGRRGPLKPPKPFQRPQDTGSISPTGTHHCSHRRPQQDGPPDALYHVYGLGGARLLIPTCVLPKPSLILRFSSHTHGRGPASTLYSFPSPSDQ